MRKSRLIVGISLAVQTVTMLLLFLVFLNKNKKQLAGTFLTIGLLGGTISAWLLYTEYLESENKRHIEKMDACYDCGDGCIDCNCFDDLDELDEENDNCEVNYSIQSDEEPEA